jgi:DNA-binding MarR family transcriptional regulator
MQKDFLDDLGELALGSRLKRLSEKMLRDTANVYQGFALNVQAKWFPLLALLHRKQRLNVVEASEYLGLSQPAISQFCRQLADKGLVDFVICEQDSRRKVLTLTQSGRDEVYKMLPMWQALQKAAEQLCQEFENDFYRSLAKCEKALAAKSLQQRTAEAYHELYGQP